MINLKNLFYVEKEIKNYYDKTLSKNTQKNNFTYIK